MSRRAAAERLFDRLAARWRYAGPITMIGAPDLASSTIDPDEFLDFLAGRLRERFILEPAEVPVRVAAIDERVDQDARWRVTELFCGDDAWKPAVRALMAHCDVVAMDLRDFGPANQGCLFELEALVANVPPERIALLVDGSTQRDFLDATLSALAARAGVAGIPAQLDIGAGEHAAVTELMRRAAAVA